jgi:hypothetical protein
MHTRISAIGVLLVAALVLHGDAQQQTPAATLLSAVPEGWTVDGKALPASVSAGQSILAKKSGSLVLGCTQPDRLLVYSCRLEPCRAQVCTSAGGNGTMIIRPGRTLPQLQEMLGELRVRQPVLPVVAAARAGGNPSNAVLVQDALGIHWGPALTRVLEGRICFRLSSLPEGPSSRTVTFPLDWDRGIDAEGALQLPGVSAGLYALEKGDAGANGGCDRDPDAVPAWVLIVPATEFSALAAEWKQRQAAIDELEALELGPEAMTNIRRAALAHLGRTYPPR